MNSPIRIRPAEQPDAATIVEFQLAMAAETEGLHLDLATVEKGVAAVFADAAKGRYYVAEADGAIAGSLLTIPEWSDWRNGTVLWIHSVYIRPACRAQGIYKTMYEYLRTLTEQSPAYRGLRLYVDKRNQPAQAVYKKLGMSAEHYDLYEWMRRP